MITWLYNDSDETIISTGESAAGENFCTGVSLTTCELTEIVQNAAESLYYDKPDFHYHPEL